MTKALKYLSILSISTMALLVGCDGAGSSTASGSVEPGAASTERPIDDVRIKSQVESAIVGAADLPDGFSVTVDGGLVSIGGTLACEDCGGMRTPANIGSIQQTLGAIVRSVPGVRQVQFDLDYGN